MSRVNSARIAAIKAEHAGLVVEGAVMASDAFFPFRDGIDNAAKAGIKCIIQPGGSMRDEEVIAALMKLALQWSSLVCAISATNLNLVLLTLLLFRRVFHNNGTISPP